MNLYFEKLQSEVAQCGDASVLEVLYGCYRELHPTDMEQITSHFKKLNHILSKLTLRECDMVWDLVCRLCSEHEQQGFLEGIRVGTVLAMETEKIGKTV